MADGREEHKWRTMEAQALRRRSLLLERALRVMALAVMEGQDDRVEQFIAAAIQEARGGR